MASEDFVKGFVVGVGVTVALPLAVLVAVTGGRPLARAASRGAAMLGEKLRDTAEELGEIVEDLIAETRSAQSPVAGIRGEGSRASGSTVEGEPEHGARSET